jgi:hypothetical protein
MRAYLTFLVFVALFSGGLQAESYKEPRTGIEFPDTIGSYKRGKITPYQAESNKAGVAIAYHSEDAEGTVYVRELGDEAHKTAAEFLKDSLAAIKTLESQGLYSSVKSFEFSADKEKPGWKSGAFIAKAKDQLITSFIHCKIAPGHLIKIRVSTGKSKHDPLESFTNSLQQIVDDASKKP